MINTTTENFRGYLNNPLLKRARQQINWSPEMVKEYILCKDDPIYFAQKYIKIVHVDRGFIPIELYDYQEEIIHKITKNRRVSVCTSRQAGKTTTATIIILHFILFNDYKTIGLLSNKGDAAREILDRIKLAYEALPDWLQQGVVTWNKGSIELENGCKVIAAATSSSAIRGKSLAFLYVDESAWVANWEDFFASVFPTISSGNTTKILFTSTPNGLNSFYQICEGAKAGINGYEYVEVPWQRVPGRDEKWKQETLASMNFDQEKFDQEFSCQFIGSSGTLISGAALKLLKGKIALLESDGMKMYVEPAKGRSYHIVVDVSRGKNLDYSAFSVIDTTEMPYNQVCTFRSNQITPLDYSGTIYRTAKAYNDAAVLVEINDIGAQVSDSLYYDYEYENLIQTENAGTKGKRISTGFGNSKLIDKGIRTTKTVKSIGCSMLKLLIEQNQLIINDFDTIYELSRFSKKKDSYEAESGCTDDLVMGLVLFSWMSDQPYFKEMSSIDTLQNLRDLTEAQIEENLMPFGFWEAGEAEEDVIDLTENPQHPEFRFF